MVSMPQRSNFRDPIQIDDGRSTDPGEVPGAEAIDDIADRHANQRGPSR